MANPFASYSCDGSAPARPALKRGPLSAQMVMPLKRKKKSYNVPKTAATRDAASQKKPAAVVFMQQWWKDLRELTTNFAFAVLVTGVLGAQARDIVTVAALKRLAADVEGDICPERLAKFDIDSLERIICTVNHCRKKSKVIIDLSRIILRRSMPTTHSGLCQLPGTLFFCGNPL